MSIAFVAAASALSDDSNTLTISKPTGTLDGHVMVAAIERTVGSGTPSISTLSGWTLIGSVDPDSGISKGAAYYKVASSEGASYSWSLGGGSGASRSNAGGIVTYSGADILAVLDAFDSQNNGDSSTATAPTVTAARAGELLLTLIFGGSNNNNDRSATAPAGMTERVDRRQTVGFVPNVSSHLSMHDEILASAGATGTRAATLSGNLHNSGMNVLILTPAVPGYHMMI